MIVGGWYAGMPEEGKEKPLFGTCEIGSKGLGGFEAKRLFANGVELLEGAFFDLRCLFPRDSVGFELLTDFAESGA